MYVRDHCAQIMAEPSLVELGPSQFVIRFETMKVASARAALRRLIAQGTVRRGDTVVDSSSGIYALALALACHEFGLHALIVGSTTIDAGVRAQLELLGATLEQMPATDSLELDQHRRVERVREIITGTPGVHWMRQYHDPIHDEGYVPLGGEIGAILSRRGFRHVRLVAAVGSGVSSFALGEGISTTMTVSRVGVQPFGSITFGASHVDDPEIIIAGIGSSIPFGNVRHEAYDVVHWCSHAVACSATVELMRRHALFAGLSSGAAWAAARHEAEQAGHGADERTATLWVAPDTGHRYVDAVHARHAQFAPLDDFAPQHVETLEDLVKPWSRMEWGRRPGPSTAMVPDGE